MTEFKASFNHQLGKIEPSPIRQFDEDCTSIEGIIKLTLGEPDFNTPEHVKTAGIAAIQEDFSHYTVNSGLIELREAVRDFFQKKYQVNYDPQSEILVTVGATEAYSASLLAILNPGDKVLIPTPAFPGYGPVITLAGAESIEIDTSANGFVLSPEMIETAMAEHGDKVKAIILNYPSNPTGVTYTRQEVVAIAETLKKYNVFVLSDEIYSELSYDAHHVSIGEFLPEQTILISGLSKSHAMTGWRIGFVLTRSEIAREIAKTHQFLVTAATTVAQKAAVQALTVGIDDGTIMKEAYRERRDFVYQEMTALGFDIAKPSGAFYIFAKIPAGFPQDSLTFCQELAHQYRVAIVPGSAFGTAGQGYVRISYAADMSKLVEAMARIKAYIQSK